MRGIPLLEILLIFAVFGAAAVPLARLTSSAPASVVREEARAPDAALETFVTARFAHPPVSASLDGAPLEAPDFEAEFHLTPGVAPVFRARWPAGTPPTAVTLTLEPEASATVEHTFWSGGGEEALETVLPPL